MDTRTVAGKVKAIARYNSQYKSRGIKVNDEWLNFKDIEEDEANMVFSSVSIGDNIELDVEGKDRIVFLRKGEKAVKQNTLSEFDNNVELLEKCFAASEKLIRDYYPVDKYPDIFDKHMMVALGLFKKRD